jgi:hypothetical protein
VATGSLCRKLAAATTVALADTCLVSNGSWLVTLCVRCVKILDFERQVIVLFVFLTCLSI